MFRAVILTFLLQVSSYVLAQDATNDTPQALFEKGMAYGRNNEEAKAREELRKAAEQGHAEAQAIYGQMLFKAIGGTRNSLEAEKWLKKAASNGSLKSYFFLAEFYRTGAPSDMKSAISWYEKAAEAGHPDALHALGVIHIRGMDVPKNRAKGRELLEKAAALGHTWAMQDLGKFYEQDANLNEAEKWYSLAVKNGSSTAETELAAIQKAKSSGQNKRADEDALPPPGPKQTYKGKTLIGTTYPGIDNEAFFKTVKHGLDMLEKLPLAYKEDSKLIQEVIYDPPSPLRKAGGLAVTSPATYLVGPDFMKIAPVVIYRDMSGISALNFVEIFAGTGSLAKGHKEAIEAQRKINALKSKGVQSGAEYTAAQQVVDKYNGGLEKTDRAEVEERNCFGLRQKWEIYKIFDMPAKTTDAISKRIFRMNCW